MPSLIESGVDWFTTTATHGNGADELLREGQLYVQERAHSNGGSFRQVLEGYRGIACDGVFAGWRADGAMVSLSSVAASQGWRRFRVGNAHATRVDVQATLFDGSFSAALANAGYNAGRSGSSVRGKEPKRTIIRGTDGGCTLYVGAPRSERRLRLYDKCAESEGRYPKGTWRWEIICRHEAAEALARLLESSEDETEALLSFVAAESERFGVNLPLYTSQRPERYVIRRQISTDERRLQYLRDSVAPFLAKLGTRLSRRQLLDALGLWPDDSYGQPGSSQNKDLEG